MKRGMAFGEQGAADAGERTSGKTVRLQARACHRVPIMASCELTAISSTADRPFGEVRRLGRVADVGGSPDSAAENYVARCECAPMAGPTR